MLEVFVTIPLSLRVGKPKRSYRTIMLGYSEHAGQKGYIVRNLSTGKIQAVAFNQVRFYENTIVYPSPPDYDIWLTKDIKRRDKSVIPPVSHVDMESDVSDDESVCDERVC